MERLCGCQSACKSAALRSGWGSAGAACTGGEAPQAQGWQVSLTQKMSLHLAKETLRPTRANGSGLGIFPAGAAAGASGGY